MTQHVEPRAGGGKWTRFQSTALVALRILIGWHFLYEGLAKLTNPYWTSAGYLAESQWWFKGLFLNIAANPTLLTLVDYGRLEGVFIDSEFFDAPDSSAVYWTSTPSATETGERWVVDFETGRAFQANEFVPHYRVRCVR